jgi:hypothetical protein
MPTDLISSGVPNAHATSRQRLESLIDLPRLFRAIDADPSIVGAGVVHIGSDYRVTTLRAFTPICSIKPKKVILRELPRMVSPLQYRELATNSQRESQVLLEATGTLLSCSSAILGYIVAISGAAAIPFSAGASAIVTSIGYTAAAASGLQCINGGWRSYNELTMPNKNDQYDSLRWYQTMTSALDAVSLLGAATTSFSTIRMVMGIKKSTGRSTKDILRSMSRQERAKLTDEFLQLKNPRLSRELIKLHQMSGKLPKRYSNNQIRRDILNQLKDLIGASFGFAGSGLSGHLNHMVIGIYEEFDTHDI